MFLDDPKISSEDREKLSKLGARNALSVLLMRKAAPDTFDEYIGRDRAQQIQDALSAQLTDEERALLAAPAPSARPLGGRLEGAPRPLKAPPFDLEERDRLFSELQELRKSASQSLETQNRIIELQARLNQLLDASAPM